jgi:hypothetical protein
VQDSLAQVSPTQASPYQVSTAKVGFAQVSLTEVRPEQTRIAQIGPTQIDLMQIRVALQLHFSKLNHFQLKGRNSHEMTAQRVRKIPHLGGIHNIP